MVVSKSAIEDFRIWLGLLKLKYPITKTGIVRSNCSHKNRLSIGDSYNKFVRDLVSKEIRPLIEYIETVDITKLWIPHELLVELNTILNSVNPYWMLFTPEDIDRYPKELVDKDVVIFEDEIICPTKGN